MITNIIWDCDGCLIDSEIIACRVAAEHYTKVGFPITTEDYIRDFAGMSSEKIRQTVQELKGFDIWERLNFEDVKADTAIAFDNELKPIDGIHEAMEQLTHLPQAVASGSWIERLHQTLKLTDLHKFLDPHIYSSEMVGKSKPEPDVFLYAAEKLNVNPSESLVIEDGHHGVAGAKAAGMTVFGFTGSSHGSDELAERLVESGADLIFSDMRELPELIKNYNMKKSA